MILLDASVIIAAFRNDELHHQEALEILEKNTGFLLLDYVLLEVSTVLKMREGFETMQKSLDFLLDNEDFLLEKISFEDFQKITEEFYTNKNNLSFVDTALLFISQKRKIKLLSFDKELKKMSENNF